MTPKLDTVHAFETPEGVDLGLRVAGPLPRALAWAIDAAVRYALLTVLLIGIAWLAELGLGIFLIAMFAMEWFYPVVFEVWQGRTPGKKAMGLAVVHEDGTPIGWPASLIRNLLRTIDFFPAFYGAGLVTMLVNRRFQRLGDLAAGTLVIYTEPLHHRRAAPAAPPVPPPVSLAVDEQRALLDFAERSGRLSPARVEELAEIIAPHPGPEAVQTVLGHAQWVAHGQ